MSYVFSCKKAHIISLTDVPNGAENVLLNLAITIKGELIFVTKSHNYNLDVPNHLPRKYLSKRNIPLGLIKLIPLLRKLKRDELVISTHPYLNAILGIFKRVGYLKSQLVVRECTSVFIRFSGLKRYIYKVLYRIGYPAADLVICQTNLMRDQLLNHNAFINQDRVFVIPNPIDTTKLFRLASVPMDIVTKNEEFICSAGRLIPEKGFDILIEAFNIVLKTYPDLKLYILGEGEGRFDLAKRIKAYNLQESVFLKGYISNPAPYFQNAKLCVVSSIKEGFPNVLLEMMALNSRVVSTLCAGDIENIPHIYKVPPGEVQLLKDALLQTISLHHHDAINPHLSYLKQRSPEKFATSIFEALSKPK